MKANKNYSYLFSNVFLFAISSFSTKVMSYIVLPLYTSSVTEAEYGVIDLVNVVVNLLVPVLSLCISDWLLRYVVENKKQVTEKFSVACQILIGSTIVLLLLYPLISHFVLFKECYVFILIGYFLTTANLIFSYTIRALDKIKLISITSLISSIIVVYLNFCWMNFSVLSIKSYYVCQYIGILVGLLIFFFYGKLYKYLKFFRISKESKNEILTYCLPLIPNSLFWWMNSSIDKISIISLLSLSASGLYSAASKIPSLLTIFATIFQQAWNLSVFKKRDSEQREFEEKTMVYYQFILIIGAIFIIVLSNKIASFLLKGDFYLSWELIPMLVVAFIFTTISTFVGSFFTAEKNTKPLFTSSLLAAIVNLIFNISLILLLGLYGAAIATMISSFTNYLYRVWLLKKFNYVNNLYISIFLPVYLFLVALALSYKYFNYLYIQIMLIVFILFLIILFFLRKKEKYV